MPGLPVRGWSSGTAFVLSSTVILAHIPAAAASILIKGSDKAAKGLHTIADVRGASASQINADVLRSNAERARRLQGLAEVEQDLKSTEAKEDSDLKKLNGQILVLTRKRDALRHSEARRKREIAFVHTEIGRLRQRLQGKAGAAAGGQQAQKAVEAEGMNATEAAVSEASNAAAESTAVDATAAADGTAVADSTAADADAAAAEATDTASAEGTAAESVEESAAEELANSANQQKRAEQAQRAQQAAIAAQAQRLADEQERKRVEAEQKALAQQRAIEAEEKRKKDALADSADDSFKQFMKEEDGEDQMGDTDYEDSANALAGAIGWNRKEIESKADNAVKQLTQAIGGKKVVQSLQGMMAGIR